MNLENKAEVEVQSDLHDVFVKVWVPGARETHYIDSPPSLAEMLKIQNSTNQELEAMSTPVLLNTPPGPPTKREIIHRIRHLIAWWDYIGQYKVIPQSAEAYHRFNEAKIPWEFQTGIIVPFKEDLARWFAREHLLPARGTMRSSEKLSSSRTKPARVELKRRQNPNGRLVVVDDDPFLGELISRMFDVDVYVTHPRERAEQVRKACLPDDFLQLPQKGRLEYGVSLDQVAKRYT